MPGSRDRVLASCARVRARLCEGDLSANRVQGGRDGVGETVPFPAIAGPRIARLTDIAVGTVGEGVISFSRWRRRVASLRDRPSWQRCSPQPRSRLLVHAPPKGRHTVLSCKGIEAGASCCGHHGETLVGTQPTVVIWALEMCDAGHARSSQTVRGPMVPSRSRSGFLVRRPCSDAQFGTGPEIRDLYCSC